MFYLGHILDYGYYAHVVLRQSTGISHEAVTSPDVTTDTKNTSNAALMHNLARGELSMQGRMIARAQYGLSMLQTLAQATDSILETLSDMLALAQMAATGVYSDSEVAVMQDQFDDAADLIAETAESTTFDGHHLLDNDAAAVTLHLGNNVYIELSTRDLTFSRDVSLSDNAADAVQSVQQAMVRVQAYRDDLSTEQEYMEQQAALALYEVSRIMGYGMDILSHDMALEISQAIINALWADTTQALQTHVDETARPILMTINALN